MRATLEGDVVKLDERGLCVDECGGLCEEGAVVGGGDEGRGHHCVWEGEGLCACIDSDARLDVQDVQHGAHVHHGLPDLAVDRPQEVEGQRQLEQQSVDKHKVAHTHGPWYACVCV